MIRSCCRRRRKESGLCEKIFENFDEKPRSLLYSIAMDPYAFCLPGSDWKAILWSSRVYLATFDTIRRIADQGPCVIIGRCADYALARTNPNHLSLFIHAPHGRADRSGSAKRLNVARRTRPRRIDHQDRQAPCRPTMSTTPPRSGATVEQL